MSATPQIASIDRAAIGIPRQNARTVNTIVTRQNSHDEAGNSERQRADHHRGEADRGTWRRRNAEGISPGMGAESGGGEVGGRPRDRPAVMPIAIKATRTASRPIPTARKGLRFQITEHASGPLIGNAWIEPRSTAHVEDKRREAEGDDHGEDAMP